MASSNEATGQGPFNWRRTWALAVAIALHAFAFLLLVAPMAPPKTDQQKKERIVQVNFIEPHANFMMIDCGREPVQSQHAESSPRYPSPMRHQGTAPNVADRSTHCKDVTSCSHKWRKDTPSVQLRVII